MQQKTALERHIDTLNKKKIISFPDLVKLNNYNKTNNELGIGKYITFQYNHSDKKSIFNKIPFIIVTNYSQHHVTGINLLHLNIPVRTRLFDIVEKNNDINILQHQLQHIANTHLSPYTQSFSFKKFQSHILTFNKEHHNLLSKLPFVPKDISKDIKKIEPSHSNKVVQKNVIQPNIVRQV